MTDDLTPDTKADIRKLAESIDERFERLSDSVDRILDVLVSVDKRLTHEVQNHEQRIKRLESRVGIVV